MRQAMKHNRVAGGILREADLFLHRWRVCVVCSATKSCVNSPLSLPNKVIFINTRENVWNFCIFSKIHIVFDRIYKIIQGFPLFSLEIACASVYFADFHKIVRNLLQIYIYIEYNV